MYYNYIYTDPRKPGKYQYGNICLLYAPFYIGKGKGNRWKQHLQPHSLLNISYKNRKLHKLLIQYSKEEIYNHVVVIPQINENTAFEYEKTLINNIRESIKLTNITEGGEGKCGSIYDYTDVYDLFYNRIINIGKMAEFDSIYNSRIGNLFYTNTSSRLIVNRFCKLEDIEYYMLPPNNPYTIYTIYNQYETFNIPYYKLIEFCDSNNISRDLLRLCKKGGKGHINGYFLDSSAQDAYYKIYNIINPEGVIYQVIYKDLNKFSIEHNIKDWYRIIKFKRGNNQGWRILNF